MFGEGEDEQLQKFEGKTENDLKTALISVKHAIFVTGVQTCALPISRLCRGCVKSRVSVAPSLVIFGDLFAGEGPVARFTQRFSRLSSRLTRG